MLDRSHQDVFQIHGFEASRRPDQLPDILLFGRGPVCVSGHSHGSSDSGRKSIVFPAPATRFGGYDLWPTAGERRTNIKSRNPINPNMLV